MKKAVYIVGIVCMVLSILSAVAFAIVGAVFLGLSNNMEFISEFMEQLIKQDPEFAKFTIQQAIGFVQLIGVIMFIGAAWCIPGIVASALIFNGAKPTVAPGNRGSMIAKGVIAVVFSAAPAGILQIIYGAMQGKN